MTGKIKQDRKKQPETSSGSKVSVNERKNGINFLLASFNATSSMMGIGIIAIPFAFREGGFGMSIILLVLAAFVSDYAVQELYEEELITKKTSYIIVMKTVFGRPGYILSAFNMFFLSVIMMVAFNIVIADLGTKLIVSVGGPEDGFWSSRGFVVLVANAFMFPLSLYKNLKMFAVWSVISVLGKLLLVVLIAIRLSTLNIPNTADAYEFINSDVAQSFGIFALTLSLQQCCMLIFQSVAPQTSKRIHQVTHTSFAMVLVVYLAVGILGYATFTGNTQGNLLQNYCTNDTLMNIGKLVFLISSIIVFPFQLFPAQEVVEQTIFVNKQPPTTFRHVTIVFILVAGAAGASLITDCLGIVLEINGVLNGVPLCYIYPPLLHLVSHKGPKCSTKRVSHYLILTFGLVAFGAGVYTTVYDFIEGVTCLHGQEPSHC